MVANYGWPYPRGRHPIPRLRSPLRKHTHIPIKRAIFLVILLATFAWLTLIAAGSSSAEPPPKQQRTLITTTTTLAPPTTTIAPPTTTTVKRTEPYVYRTVTLCPQQIVDLIHKHFDTFGTGIADWYIGIAWRESNCRPDVVSPTRCYGIGQLALPLHRRFFEAQGLDWTTSWMDAEANIVAASLLYREQGANPWHL